MRANQVITALALVALCAQSAHAHGYLAIPKSRNFLNPAD